MLTEGIPDFGYIQSSGITELLQTIAIRKRVGINELNIFPDFYYLQPFTMLKGSLHDRHNAIGYNQLGQTGATVKGTKINIHQCFGQFNRSEVGTFSERILRNPCNRIFNTSILNAVRNTEGGII